MAAITMPDSVKRYFPQNIDPTHLWVNYNPQADTLTVYFTDAPVPSVWEYIEKGTCISVLRQRTKRA